MRLVLGVRTYDLTTRALVMGVLDAPGGGSSSGGGATDIDGCLGQAERLVDDGADLLEVGSATVATSGPELSEAAELDVVVPRVRALVERVDAPLCCATARASVARAAYAAGAVVGDDPSGFADPGYLPAAAAAGASVVARRPAPPRPGPVTASLGHDVVDQVRASLAEQAGRAEEAGLSRERIVLDPGLRAAATREQALRLLRASPALAELGYPLLASIPQQLLAGRADGGPADRRGTTVAASGLAIVGGCRVLRAHDVRTARRVADVLAGILGAG